MQTIDEITKWLKENLSEKRFNHTIGVANTAKSLAEKWNANSEKAFLAGLVHDCAKEISVNETISRLEGAGYNLTQVDKQAAGILHAPLGAVLAKELFGIDDSELLDAIRYHTTGRANMTLLEKIIYVADFTEPNRLYKESDEVRLLAENSLDKAALKETDIVIKFTIDKGNVIHPDTIYTRNYLLNLINEVSLNEN